MRLRRILKLERNYLAEINDNINVDKILKNAKINKNNFLLENLSESNQIKARSILTEYLL